MEWKKGPLPANTWGWGGVVSNEDTSGFNFADFCGDHVTLPDGRRIEASDVAMYNNGLTLPAGATKRHK